MNASPRAGHFRNAARKWILLPGALLFLTLVSCDDLVFRSVWHPDPILVDGQLAEWEDATRYLEEQRVSVGLMNDDSHFYLSLSTPDPGLQRQILAPGFTVRVSPDGNDSQFLAVRFPLGLGKGGPPEGEHERPRPGDFERGPDLETVIREYQGSGVEMEILVPGETPGEDEVLRMGVEQGEGIAVALGNVQGNLVYELELPLRQTEDTPYAVGLEDETVLHVQVTSGLKNREHPIEDRGAMRSPEDGRVGPGPSGMSGPPRGPMPSGPGGPLDLKAKVQLASPPGK